MIPIEIRDRCEAMKLKRLDKSRTPTMAARERGFYWHRFKEADGSLAYRLAYITSDGTLIQYAVRVSLMTLKASAFPRLYIATMTRNARERLKRAVREHEGI